MRAVHFGRGSFDAGSDFSLFLQRCRSLRAMCGGYGADLGGGSLPPGSPDYLVGRSRGSIAAPLWQYLGWWASSFPRDPQFSTSFYIFLTQTILRLITCLAVYLLVRCSHGAVLILISAGGLYLLLSLTGYNDNFAGVVVLLAGALALVARGSYWRYFTGKNTQGKTPAGRL